MRKIKSHSQKRNTTSYDLAGGGSPTDLAEVIKDLDVLREQVNDWLKAIHSALLKDDSKQALIYAHGPHCMH